MNVPRLNWIPKNSASGGTGAVVAIVSGPRTVSRAAPRWRVTTISQWLTATEMKDGSDSLRVCHVCSIRGERDDRSSNVNNSAARFMTTPTDGGTRTHRNADWSCRWRVGRRGLSSPSPRGGIVRRG